MLCFIGSVNICYEIRNKLKSARFIDNHESRKPIFASTILNNFSHCSIERQNIANIYASVTSQEKHQVELLGPTRLDHRW